MGRDTKLRLFLEDQRAGYVLKIPCSFRVTLPTGQRVRADHAARLVPARAWQTASAGQGIQGRAGLRLGMAGPPALATTCSSAAASPIRLTWRTSAATCQHNGRGGLCARQELVRAGRQPGPPLHTDLPAPGPRHGRAHGLRRHRGVSAPPHQHPDTLAYLARSAATRRPWPDRADRRRDQARLQPDHPHRQPIRHYLRWSWWRRRHQARARWFHQPARL